MSYNQPSINFKFTLTPVTYFDYKNGSTQQKWLLVL